MQLKWKEKKNTKKNFLFLYLRIVFEYILKWLPMHIWCDDVIRHNNWQKVNINMCIRIELYESVSRWCLWIVLYSKYYFAHFMLFTLSTNVLTTEQKKGRKSNTRNVDSFTLLIFGYFCFFFFCFMGIWNLRFTVNFFGSHVTDCKYNEIELWCAFGFFFSINESFLFSNLIKIILSHRLTETMTILLCNNFICELKRGKNIKLVKNPSWTTCK